MAKGSNIVHQYFRKEIGDATILVKLNPIQLTITEITVFKGSPAELREIEADPDIAEDLKHDGFTDAGPLEFNLHLAGLAGGDEANSR